MFKQSKTKTDIPYLFYENSKVEDDQIISNIFNDFFCNIGKKLASKIESEVNYDEYLRFQESSMFLSETTTSEIDRIIDKIKNKNSFGNDELPIKALKIGKEELSKIITKLVNLSFKLGKFPNCLKVAKLVPIHKSGSKHQTNNYRPISLLNVLSKLFEEVMNLRIRQFLEQKKLIADCQYGFRDKHSTETAIISLTDHVYKNIDEKKFIMTTFIDLKKAFDTVDHNILKDKLYRIGIRGKPHDWLKDYLTERYQYTCINNKLSDQSLLEVGLPQGGKLSPILYLIYVNDITQFSKNKNSKLVLFADDTCLTLTNNDINSLFENANCEINKLNKWFMANKLTLNVDKTNYIMFQNKNTPEMAQTLNIGNYKIEEKRSINYLGVILDNKLNFKEHVQYCVTKLYKKTPILIRAKDKMSEKTKEKIYYAFIYPHLSYSSSVYGNAKTNVKVKLQKIQNQIIKILFHNQNKQKTNELYKKHKILKIENIILLNKIKLIFRYNKGIFVPNEIKNNFDEYITNDRNYHLRNANNFPTL